MSFTAGVALTAAQLNSAAPVGANSTYNAAATQTASATYIDGTSVVSLAFVTPPSGKILITISGGTENSAGGTTSCSYRISGAAGTVAASDDWGIHNDAAFTMVQERTSIQTGLVPGAAGTITLQYKRTGETDAINYRGIVWLPLPA